MSSLKLKPLSGDVKFLLDASRSSEEYSKAQNAFWRLQVTSKSILKLWEVFRRSNTFLATSNSFWKLPEALRSLQKLRMPSRHVKCLLNLIATFLTLSGALWRLLKLWRLFRSSSESLPLLFPVLARRLLNNLSPRMPLQPVHRRSFLVPLAHRLLHLHLHLLRDLHDSPTDNLAPGPSHCYRNLPTLSSMLLEHYSKVSIWLEVELRLQLHDVCSRLLRCSFIGELLVFRNFRWASSSEN